MASSSSVFAMTLFIFIFLGLKKLLAGYCLSGPKKRGGKNAAGVKDNPFLRRQTAKLASPKLQTNAN